MKHTIQKGFTLIEMVAVLGIFSIVSAIVLFNYDKFRSETILTNMAYEIALSIREAQIYGVSARNSATTGTPDFTIPYGIYVLKDSSNYILFSDQSKDSKFTGTNCIDTGDVCVTPYTLQRNMRITDINTKESSVSACVSIDYASILFKRPNPEPVISDDAVRTLSYIEIEVSPQGGDSKRYVRIANNGQISVTNETLCP